MIVSWPDCYYCHCYPHYLDLRHTPQVRHYDDWHYRDYPTHYQCPRRQWPPLRRVSSFQSDVWLFRRMISWLFSMISSNCWSSFVVFPFCFAFFVVFLRNLAGRTPRCFHPGRHHWHHWIHRHRSRRQIHCRNHHRRRHRTNILLPNHCDHPLRTRQHTAHFLPPRRLMYYSRHCHHHPTTSQIDYFCLGFYFYHHHHHQHCRPPIVNQRPHHYFLRR
mmetsp:Transcript_8344/g.15116  ORF Transcript_8344/g.15116 Transcript_8344/m.15116 type:complete len:218 (+) Transcript_8344:1467-2120(+)